MKIGDIVIINEDDPEFPGSEGIVRGVFPSTVIVEVPSQGTTFVFDIEDVKPVDSKSFSEYFISKVGTSA